jgi:hypothetical protein
MAYRKTFGCEQPDCDGEMVSTGNGRSNNFYSYWEHACNKCKHREDMEGVKYPYIVHKPIEFKFEETKKI